MEQSVVSANVKVYGSDGHQVVDTSLRDVLPSHIDWLIRLAQMGKAQYSIIATIKQPGV